MNHPWSVPVVHSTVNSESYALYQQYPQPLLGYETYISGSYPWILPSYYTSLTSINQYSILPYMGSGWYQPQVTHPGEVELSPPAKRSSPMEPCDDLLPHSVQVGGLPPAKNTYVEPDEDLPTSDS